MPPSQALPFCHKLETMLVNQHGQPEKSQFLKGLDSFVFLFIKCICCLSCIKQVWADKVHSDYRPMELCPREFNVVSLLLDNLLLMTKPRRWLHSGSVKFDLDTGKGEIQFPLHTSHTQAILILKSGQAYSMCHLVQLAEILLGLY